MTGAIAIPLNGQLPAQFSQANAKRRMNEPMEIFSQIVKIEYPCSVSETTRICKPSGKIYQ